MKKKVLAALICLALVVSLPCCGGNSAETTSDKAEVSAQDESSTVDVSATEDSTTGENTSVDEETSEETSEDSIVASLPYRYTITAGDDITMALCENGPPLFAGREPYITPSSNTVSIDCYNHYVALQRDGTVHADSFEGLRKNIYGELDVSEWKDIVAVTAGWTCSAGLKSDGTVEVAGKLIYNGNETVATWTDIVAIDAGYFLAGLKSDGTVVVAGSDKSLPDVSGWSDIVAISTSASFLAGLKSDGTVVAVSASQNDPKCDVSEWKDIVSISAGLNHVVGLKSDGTVVATKITDPEYDRGECNVEGWTDIVAVAANYNHTVGLKADGTVLATGANTKKQCEVSDWTGVQKP